MRHHLGREQLQVSQRLLPTPSGATLADAEANGTITNSDAMPQAWLARFGRTVTGQVMDAVSARLEGAPGAHVTLGRQPLGMPGEAVSPEALARLEDAARDAWDRDGRATRTMTERELVLGSAFHLSSGEGARTWRMSARWKGAPDATLRLEGARREAANDGAPEHGLMLRGTLRW